MIVKALHGFLGSPNDWISLFQGHVLQDNLKAERLFVDNIPHLAQWAKQFNANEIQSGSQAIMGYSLGGRLALHALLDNPEKWSCAIIISAHLGLDNSEKEKRSEIDEYWAKRFEADSWEVLIRDWNKRDVFKPDPFWFKRDEAAYSRTTLAEVLRKWSLAHQSNLQERISDLSMPILWIVGAEDKVYVEQTLQLHLSHPHSEIWIVPNAGHRMPWEYPEKFLLKITQFLEMVHLQSLQKGKLS